MTALDASAVGKITVKSPAVEDTVELKANIAIQKHWLKKRHGKCVKSRTDGI